MRLQTMLTSAAQLRNYQCRPTRQLVRLMIGTTVVLLSTHAVMAQTSPKSSGRTTKSVPKSQSAQPPSVQATKSNAQRTNNTEIDIVRSRHRMTPPIIPKGRNVGVGPAFIYQNNIEHSIAYRQLSQLIKTTGHRLTGSPEGKAATQFIKTALQGIGFGTAEHPHTSVELQPFSVQAWSREEVSLDVVPVRSDNYAPIACVSLAQTPAFSNVQAPILDCGNGLPEDWARLGTAVKGKTALFTIPAIPSSISPTPSTNIHRSEKIALAIKAGAVACILINGAPGDILLTGTASATGAIITVPAVCISQNSGKTLLGWLATESLVADLKVRNKIEPQEVHNVIATVRGTDLAEEEIVVGCHLDSWDLAQGACDNGAGSAAVLEMARLLADNTLLRPRRTIKFVWFMGEEQGLLGSQHYVSQLIKSKRKKGAGQTKYMVNLDMAYNSTGFNAFGRPEALDFFDDVGEENAYQDTSYHQKLTNKAGLHSDHEPFMLEGIPVASPDSRWSAEALNCYHADCDRLNWISPEGLDRTARITAILVCYLSCKDKLPAQVLDPAQTKDFLIRNGLEEALRLRGEWKW